MRITKERLEMVQGSAFYRCKLALDFDCFVNDVFSV